MRNSGSKINTPAKLELPGKYTGLAIVLAQGQETLREQDLSNPVAVIPPPGYLGMSFGVDQGQPYNSYLGLSIVTVLILPAGS
jgi:hypothetical protein